MKKKEISGGEIIREIFQEEIPHNQEIILQDKEVLEIKVIQIETHQDQIHLTETLQIIEILQDQETPQDREIGEDFKLSGYKNQ